MAENVEEIEAKLAAYVDGELTPAERVEIETYLQTNPSHRILLQDLMRVSKAIEDGSFYDNPALRSAFERVDFVVTPSGVCT